MQELSDARGYFCAFFRRTGLITRATWPSRRSQKYRAIQAKASKESKATKGSVIPYMKNLSRKQQTEADFILAPMHKKGEPTGKHGKLGTEPTDWFLPFHSMAASINSSKLAEQCRLAKPEKGFGHRRVLRINASEEAGKGLVDYLYNRSQSDASYLNDEAAAELAEIARKLDLTDLEAMCNRKEGEEARGKSNDLEGTNKSNILDQGKTEVEDARLLGWLATLPIHRVDIIWHFLGRVKSAEERSSEDDPRFLCWRISPWLTRALSDAAQKEYWKEKKKEFVEKRVHEPDDEE